MCYMTQENPKQIAYPFPIPQRREELSLIQKVLILGQTREEVMQFQYPCKYKGPKHPCIY